MENQAEDEAVVPLATLLAGLRATVERTRALPCSAALDSGGVGAAVDECYRAGLMAACSARGMDGICPRRVERSAVLDAIGAMVRARVPGAEGLLEARRNLAWADPAPVDPSPAEVLVASRVVRRRLDGSLAPLVPLLDTDATRVALSFARAEPAEVEVAGGRAAVKLTGREWALVLGGDVGVGKTVAACLVALAAVDGLVVRAPELAPRRGATDKARAAAADLFERAIEAPALVLDELGAESDQAQWDATDAIVEVLARRYDRRLRTVITTNLAWSKRGDVDGIAERYDPRVRSRLEGATARVGIRGPSLRTGR